MDRTTDAIYIADTKFDEQMLCLALVAKIKGLRLIPTQLEPVAKNPAIIYRGVQVQGWWPCVDYLLDVRPYPNLLPNSVQQRAIVRTSVDLILSQPFYIGQFHQLYAKQGNTDGCIELPHATPLLLDIAIASYEHTPVADTFPWVKPLADAVNDEIASILPDQTEEEILKLA